MTKLFEDFNPKTDQEWLDKLSTDLKGKSADDIAKSRPYEGLDLKVFYTSSDVNEGLNLNLSHDWNIVTEKFYLETVIADPISHLAQTGNWLNNEEIDLKVYSSIFKSESEDRNMGVNGLIYNEAGSSAVQELAFIISHANEYFNELKEEELLPNNALQKLTIKVGIGGDYFMEIAKIRALRILVQNLAKAYDLDDSPAIQLFAQNSAGHYSSADMDTNILRSTTACMSAVIGGCDHLVLLPHDHFANESHDFGNRIARNLQLIMKNEAHLDKVMDPSSGSYYLESLTKELSQRAWDLFKKIEAMGGFIEAFRKEEIQRMVKETANLRIKRFKENEDVLVGINQYQKENAVIAAKDELVSDGQFKALRPLILEEAL